MACGATLSLKRNFEHEPLHSPHHASPKRRCLPLTMSPATPPTKCYELGPSPFVAATPKMTPEQIAAHISAEVKRLHHRRQLHFSNSNPPSPSMSASSVLGMSLSNTDHATDMTSTTSEPITAPSSSAMRLFSSLSPNKSADTPLFTFRQVSMICERMLKDHENLMREQYETVLTSKLAEQYEAFLKFSHDQLHRRFGESAASYVS